MDETGGNLNLVRLNTCYPALRSDSAISICGLYRWIIVRADKQAHPTAIISSGSIRICLYARDLTLLLKLDGQ